MDVCAVLVNYRGAPDIAAAAASVLADSPGVELLVVDNSESANETERLRTLLPPQARLIVASHNLGFGAACNLALQHSRAAAAWLVNPDVRVLPGCLQALVAALEADPRLAAVAPRQTLDLAQAWQLPPATLPTAIDRWARAQALSSLRSRRRFVGAARAQAVRLWTAAAGDVVPQRALSGGAMLVRRACLAAGESLFDPRYFMYYEDSDFCLRLRRRGWRLAGVPAARAVHLWRLGSHKDGLMAQSEPLYFEKHFPGSPWLGREPSAAGVALPAFRPVTSADDLQVPAALQSGWVFELSPTPLLDPAAACVGSGPMLPWPGVVMAACGPVPLYARLGPQRAVAREDECLLLRFDHPGPQPAFSAPQPPAALA
jgi:GT2 family glycosyltransferase